MRIGIVGNGFVGKATQLLKNKDVEIVVYDKDPNLCEPIGLELPDLLDCDIVFVSVPTPMNKDGSVYTCIVDSVVEDLKSVGYDGFIVVRSTVPPGTCDRLGVYFMPEFLTEKNYQDDFVSNPDWVYGLLGESKDALFKTKISQLIDTCYRAGCIRSDKISYLTNKEAEMVKYFRNTFLAVKVSYCNEIYQLCKKTGIDYDKVSQVACRDSRIGLSHTSVPGPDGRFGFGGTCFPKDTMGLLTWIEENGGESCVLKSAIKRNREIDRKEKDWEKNKGRSVV